MPGAGSKPGSTTLRSTRRGYQVPEAEGLAAWFETLLGKPRSQERISLVAEVAGRVVGNVEAHLEQPVDSAPRQLLRHWASGESSSTRSVSRTPTVAAAWPPS